MMRKKTLEDKTGKIILFDIDRTLLDNPQFGLLLKKEFSKILNTNNTSLIDEAKKEYIDSLKYDREFTPSGYVKTLCQKFNFDKQELLLDVFYNPKYDFIFKNSLFSDSLKTLELLNKLGYKLGVYSEAERKFQLNKIHCMGIEKYLDPNFIFIFDIKDTDQSLSKIPQKAVIIDDKERICDFLKSRNINVIWLNRIDGRDSSKYPTIHDLLELQSILG